MVNKPDDCLVQRAHLRVATIAHVSSRMFHSSGMFDSGSACLQHANARLRERRRNKQTSKRELSRSDGNYSKCKRELRATTICTMSTHRVGQTQKGVAVLVQVLERQQQIIRIAYQSRQILGLRSDAHAGTRHLSTGKTRACYQLALVTDFHKSRVTSSVSQVACSTCR